MWGREGGRVGETYAGDTEVFDGGDFVAWGGGVLVESEGEGRGGGGTSEVELAVVERVEVAGRAGEELCCESHCVFLGGGVSYMRLADRAAIGGVEELRSAPQRVTRQGQLCGSSPGNSPVTVHNEIFKKPTSTSTSSTKNLNSTMAPPHSKKRRTAPAEPSSDSNSDSNSDSDSDSSAGVTLEDEFDLASSSSDDASKTGESSDSNSDGDSDISDILAAQTVPTKKRKRNNPAAFSETMSKILSSHLTTTARKDPVLVRAKKFQENIDDSKLEAKARRALKEERRRELEKGRVKDVVPRGDDEGARRALELEKRLRKTAQRGGLGSSGERVGGADGV